MNLEVRLGKLHAFRHFDAEALKLFASSLEVKHLKEGEALVEEGDTTTDGFGQFILSLDYSKEDTDCCALATITYEGLSTLNSPITSTPSAQWHQWY